MRALVGVLVVVMLAGPSARAGGLPEREQVAEGVEVAQRTELGKILAVVEYDRNIGKITRVHYYRAKTDKLDAAKRIYVRVKPDARSRREALQMQESIVKSILKETPHRTVGSVEDADMILEVEFMPAGRTGR
jgi:hypothetical protein